jgi:hypothetical protein
MPHMALGLNMVKMMASILLLVRFFVSRIIQPPLPLTLRMRSGFPVDEDSLVRQCDMWTRGEGTSFGRPHYCELLRTNEEIPSASWTNCESPTVWSTYRVVVSCRHPYSPRCQAGRRRVNLTGGLGSGRVASRRELPPLCFRQ